MGSSPSPISSDLAGRAASGRKLVAIVYADVVGYSRLIELDDIGTLEQLRALRGDLIDPENPPVTLRPDADLDTVATELVESRRSSLLVVDDEGRPLGRILSDDVLDALVPGHGRLHFPRLLQ